MHTLCGPGQHGFSNKVTLKCGQASSQGTVLGLQVLLDCLEFVFSSLQSGRLLVCSLPKYRKDHQSQEGSAFLSLCFVVYAHTLHTNLLQDSGTCQLENITDKFGIPGYWKSQLLPM